MLLSARGISKGFTGVQALTEVDFDLQPGEIHALMGENGAGKSTLIKVLTGVHGADSGEIRLKGSIIQPSSPAHAVQLGISTVYQEVNLVPNLSVAENVCLGRESRGLLGIRWKQIRLRAENALQRLGVQVDGTRQLGSCSVAVQQLTAIARALDVSCDVLILDEPTSSLDRHEVEQLFGVLRKLKAEGMGIVFITHFLDQVYEIADRISVLRNGRVAGTFEPSLLSRQALVSSMIGRDSETVPDRVPSGSGSIGQPFLDLSDVASKRGLRDVNFAVAPGEILGLAGLLGSGRTEVVRLLFGVDSASNGTLSIDGRTARRFGTPRAIRAGFALCPEDRKAEGLLPGLSLRENLILVLQARQGWWRSLSRKRQEELVKEAIAKLQIAASDGDQRVEHLSGGNQQKVLLARWLAADPRLLLLDEPTRGIDVGAKFEISRIMEDLRQRGKSMVFVSSELEEVVRSSTKVAILRDRAMVALLKDEAITEGSVMGAIAGDPA